MYHSEAEIIFGSHLILDFLGVINCIPEILETVISFFPQGKTLVFYYKVAKLLFFSCSVKDTMSEAANMVTPYIQNDLLKNAPPEWCDRLLDVLTVIGDISYSTIQLSDLNDIYIFEKVKSLNFNTQYSINNVNISMEEVLNLCDCSN